MSEIRIVSSLALLYVFRMLGLFMVLPVLVLYGTEYERATPMLLGMALGVYGLTQAVFQVPLGLLSDIWGRKLIIVGGMVLFAVGSVVAAVSTSIEGVIIGRALQGAGAIASAIMAMVADLTSEENRTKAMAAIGASIGLSFTLAMILGPAVAAGFGLQGVFGLSALLALVGIAIMLFVVPTPSPSIKHTDAGAIPGLIGGTLRNVHLLRLNWGIFTLHAVLMAVFLAIPQLLVDFGGMERARHWVVYLPVLLLSFVFMVPLMMMSEKKKQVKGFFIFSIMLLAGAMALLAREQPGFWLIVIAVFVFFVAFNFLEATLPSWVSKVAPAGAKGTAMGIYSTSQFLGAFLGGFAGGWLLTHHTYVELIYFCIALVILWCGVALFMASPKYLRSMCVETGDGFSELDRVLALDGVEEAKHVPDEGLLYLKVEQKRFNELELEALLAGEAQKILK